MTLHATNLQQAVAAAAMGDRASFAKLVEAHTATVCAITLAITGEIQSSEDVAQDVFMAAWLGVGQLRNATSFGPWLRQLARNKSNEFVRMARRRQKRIFVDGGNALAVAVDGTAMTSEQLILAEQESMLVEVLRALGPRLPHSPSRLRESPDRLL